MRDRIDRASEGGENCRKLLLALQPATQGSRQPGELVRCEHDLARDRIGPGRYFRDCSDEPILRNAAVGIGREQERRRIVAEPQRSQVHRHAARASRMRLLRGKFGFDHHDGEAREWALGARCRSSPVGSIVDQHENAEIGSETPFLRAHCLEARADAFLFVSCGDRDDVAWPRPGQAEKPLRRERAGR